MLSYILAYALRYCLPNFIAGWYAMIKKIKNFMNDYFAAKYSGSAVLSFVPEPLFAAMPNPNIIDLRRERFDYTIEVLGEDIATYTVEFNTYGGIAEDIKVSIKLADDTYFEMPPLDNWPIGSMAQHIQERVESYLRGEL